MKIPFLTYALTEARKAVAGGAAAVASVFAVVLADGFQTNDIYYLIGAFIVGGVVVWGVPNKTLVSIEDEMKKLYPASAPIIDEIQKGQSGAAQPPGQ